MLKHVVAFSFKPEVEESARLAILDELDTFPDRYPAMRNWVLGPNISNRDTTMSHVFTVEFATRTELDAYLTGQSHESFVAEKWRPVIARQTIVTVDSPYPNRTDLMTVNTPRPHGPYAFEYARLAVPDLAASIDFYTDHVGLSVEERSAEHAFLRADISHHVIELVEDTTLTDFDCLALGYSAESATVLAEIRQRLEDKGIDVFDMHPRTAVLVEDGFAVKDPNGQTVEIFVGFEEYAEPPLVEWRPLEIVHPFLSTPVYRESQEFYLDVLGFLASDFIISDGFGASSFIRGEDRYHHSLALRQDNSFYVAHLCFKMKSLDHVMRGRAKALYKDTNIASDIVNHSASTSIAFYLYEPQHGPRIELCDGHRIFTPEEHETHQARRMTADPRNIDVWRAASDDWERF